MDEYRGKGFCHRPICGSKAELSEFPLGFFLVEERNECVGDIPYLVPIRIAVDHRRRIFYQHGFGGNDEFIGSSLFDPWKEFILVRHDHISHTALERRHRLSTALIHDFDVALDAFNQIVGVLNRSGFGKTMLLAELQARSVDCDDVPHRSA